LFDVLKFNPSSIEYFAKQRCKKIVLLRKAVLFCHITPDLTYEDKQIAWKNIIEKAQSISLISQKNIEITLECTRALFMRLM